MPTLAEIRAKYPQYKDLSDKQLLDGLHRKYYADLPEEVFLQKVGAAPAEDSGGLGGFLGAPLRGVASTLGNMSHLIKEAPEALASAVTTGFAPLAAIKEISGLAGHEVDPLAQVAKQVQPAYQEHIAPQVEAALAGPTAAVLPNMEQSAKALRDTAGPGAFPSLAKARGIGQTAGSIAETSLEGMVPTAAALGVGALTKSPAAATAALNVAGLPYGDIRDAGGSVDQATTGSAIIGAMNSMFGAGKVAAQLGSPEAVALAREAATSALKRVPVEILKTATAEAIENTAQTAVQMVASNQDPLSKEGQDALIESFVVGAAAGAGTKAISHGANRLMDRGAGEADTGGETLPDTGGGPTKVTRDEALGALTENLPRVTDPGAAGRVETVANAYARQVSNDLSLGLHDELSAYLDDQQTKLDSDTLDPEEATARGALLKQARALLRETGYKPQVDDEGAVDAPPMPSRDPTVAHTWGYDLSQVENEANDNPSQFEGQEFYVSGPEDLKYEDAVKNQKASTEGEAQAAQEPVQPVELTDEDYEQHPLMQAHNEQFGKYDEEISGLENTAAVRRYANRLIKQGVLDPGAIDDINDAMSEEERGYKLDAGVGALSDALEEARTGEAYDNIISQIDEEQASQAPDVSAPVSTPANDDERVFPFPAHTVIGVPDELRDHPEFRGQTDAYIIEALQRDRDRIEDEGWEAPKPNEPKFAAPENDNPMGSMATEMVDTPPDTTATPAPEAANENEPPGGTPNEPAPAREERNAAMRDLYEPLKGIQEKINYKYAEAPNLDRWFGEHRVGPEFETLEARKSGAVATVSNRYIKPIVNKMAKLGVDSQDMGMYILAKAAPQRNANVAKRNPEFTQGGSGLTDAEAADVIDTFRQQGKLAQLQQFDPMLRALVNHTLDTQVRMGNMSAADKAALIQNEPNWAKLSGFADEKEAADHNDSAWEGGSRAAGVSYKNFIAPQGRATLPFNPLFNTFEWAMRAVNQAQVQPASQAFVRMLKDLPKAQRDRFAGIYTDAHPKVQHLISPDDITGMTKAVPNMRDEMRGKEDNWLLLKENGKPVYVEFNQKTPEGRAVARLFRNTKAPEINAALRFAGKLASMQRSLFTRRNPYYFTGTAQFRDLAEAEATLVHAQNSPNNPAYKKPLASKFNYQVSINGPHNTKAIHNWLGGAEPTDARQRATFKLLDEMLEDGGAPLHAMYEGAQDMANKAVKRAKTDLAASNGDPLALGKQALGSAFKALDRLNDISDLMPRFATYRAARDAGISRKNAGRLALDSSLDLSRRGTWSAMTDMFFPFFSTSIEGSRKMGRLGGMGDARFDTFEPKAWEALKNGQFTKIIKNPVATGKVVGAFIALGMLESALGNNWDSDEDKDGQPDYLDVPDSMQQTRAIFKYGPGGDDYFMLPMGQMLGFFKFVGAQLANTQLTGKNHEGAALSITDAGKNVALGLANALSPARVYGGDVETTLTSLAPLGIKPWFEAMNNRNFFGTPIYTEAHSDKQVKANLGRAATGQMWKSLAQWVNQHTGGSDFSKGYVDMQPEIYRYVLTQMAGGPGRLLNDMLTLKEGTGNETGAARIPIVKGFVGRGFDFVPMNKYQRNTKRIASFATAENKHNTLPEQWARSQSKFPLDTDPELLQTYRDTEKTLVALRKQRKQDTEGVTDPVQRDAILDSYQEQFNEQYENFNRAYVQAKRRLEK